MFTGMTEIVLTTRFPNSSAFFLLQTLRKSLGVLGMRARSLQLCRRCAG